MAEFQEVLRQFDRMCRYYQRNFECPMCCPMDGVNISQCRKVAFEKSKETEKTVMAWAAEHPEPVYPTWIEWLKSMGIIPYLDGRVVKHDYDDNYLNGHVNVNEIIFKPIPKDVAEKLGIEPKEG